MKTKYLIILTILVTVTAGAVWYFAIQDNRSSTSENSEGNSITDSKSQEDSADNDPYAELIGDEFDEAYIAGMLAHHEGAVNMAEQAQAATAREEIRVLAGNITASQSREMAQMRQWQQKWGYETTNSAGHMSHGGSGADMAGDMVEMQNSLLGLTGEEFDREFLKQMIVHHEQAVDMSKYADTNAKHQEIKDLARAVISDQEAEIAQMRQWQQEWGY